MGYLAATGERSEGGLRRAIVFGSVLASFIVEDFGGQRLRTLTRDDIDRRYRQFVALTEFLAPPRPRSRSSSPSTTRRRAWGRSSPSWARRWPRSTAPPRGGRGA